MIQAKEVHVIVSCGQLAVGKIKVWFPRDRLFEQRDCVAQFFFDLTVERDRCDQSFGANVRAIGGEVFSRPLANRSFFFGRNFNLKLQDDLLHDLALNGKNFT